MTNRIILVALLFGGVVSASSLKVRTFTDANWVSPGSANGTITATAVDGSGNLYIGGSFSAVEGVNATNIAKWDGTNWTALAGLNGTVFALTAWGSNVYGRLRICLGGVQRTLPPLIVANSVGVTRL